MAPFLDRLLARMTTANRRQKHNKGPASGEPVDFPCIDATPQRKKVDVTAQRKQVKTSAIGQSILPLSSQEDLTPEMIRDIVYMDRISKSMQGTSDGEEQDEEAELKSDLEICAQTGTPTEAGTLTAAAGSDTEHAFLDEGMHILCKEGTVDNFISLLRTSSFEEPRSQSWMGSGFLRHLNRLSE